MSTLSEVEKLGDAEFKWGKKKGVGGKKKEVQFYGSFTYDGIDYELYDCVYMHTDDGPEPYIGKLVKIWEDKFKRTKRIKVQWFFRPSEIFHWLIYHKVDAFENEIFLATGEGVGMANVNFLEALAGKCSVLCISKDSRNPLPSAEQRKMADYVFYRTFDVQNHSISDNMDDKVGGLGVEFVFNRRENDMLSCQKLISKQKEDDTAIAVSNEGTLQIMDRKSVEILGNGKVDEDHYPPVVKGDSDDRKVLVKVDTSIVEKNNAVGCDANAVMNEICDSGASVNQIEAKESIKSARGSGSLDNRPSKRAKFDSSVKSAKDKDIVLVKESTSLGNDVKGALPAEISLEETAKTGRIKEVVGMEKSKNLKESSILADRTLKKQRNQEYVKVSENKNTIMSGSAAVDKTKFVKDSLKVEDRPPLRKPIGQLNKFTKTSSNLDKNSPLEMVDEKNKRSYTSLGQPPRKEAAIGTMSGSMGFGKVVAMGNPKDKKYKQMETPQKDHTISKVKLDEKSTPPNGNVAKLSKPSTCNVSEIIEGRIIEVTRRPDVDNIKWFRSLPWVEMMQTAGKQQRLVLLQNLDRESTSSEVEDIVWHAFKENCTAKVVPQFTSSSPLHGQALVIFKTREAAKKAVNKLEDGCLVLMNQRPIVGHIVDLSTLERNKSTFVGHLCFDKLKLHIQRDMKDALSTPHCSQPNTIEYDLAMEWCLLQSRLEYKLQLLYKTQGHELKEKVKNLKIN